MASEMEIRQREKAITLSKRARASIYKFQRETTLSTDVPQQRCCSLIGLAKLNNQGKK
jgi:hypothetical protein